MNAIRKAGILILMALFALAWVKLDPDADARTQRTTSAPEVECTSRSLCNVDPRFAYPVGDGLVVLDEFL